jgi:hypothetical protein
MFSGPHQYPFVCTTMTEGLGQPVPDDPATGTRVLIDGETVGFSRAAWNGRLIFRFDGGVGLGHSQGHPRLEGMHYEPGLAQGYAVAYSTGTRTNVHYNLQLGGETALMVKERFIVLYDRPVHTLAIGGSGGAVQQYLYAQNHPGLLDGGIAQYSYPDMATQVVHVSDCELLEYYFDVADAANPRWSTWPGRSRIQGLAASDTLHNPFTGDEPGMSECIKGWRGLTPLVLNPHYGRATNQALRDGSLTVGEFLDLNASIGGWKESAEMVQEACPFYPVRGCFDPDNWDPWSVRNQVTGTPGVPAPRTAGAVEAMQALYRAGLVFTGDIGIPIIDWRHYLERELDMHHAHQSFAARQRILDARGRAPNQLIWFTDSVDGSRFDQTPEALAVLESWLTRTGQNPKAGVAGNRPPDAKDRCFDASGREIAAGADVWRGVLDGADTVNGASAETVDAYQFMIWAGDGDPDTFRIKIWYEDDGEEVPVYDNAMDQPIGGGEIVIHTQGNLR